ncbi:MAG: DUF1559 domain-containing protein [Isosphaeraceae bacterium]|nr:DUF1559 domain-containing protein [Isosphaeraceae bacterium]
MRVSPHLVPDRRAMTLIELVAVVAIVGVLVGLTLIAVQAARDASRRAQCANNLRQLGLALASYQSTYSVFPFGNAPNAYSLHVAILPYLGQQALYDAIDRRTKAGFAPDRTNGNYTAYTTNLAVFLCPSDSRPTRVPSGWTNYAGNGGSGVQKYGYNGLFVPHAFARPVGPGDVTDGSSNTVAMAEWLLGSGDKNRKDPLRSIFRTPEVFDRPHELEVFATSCRELDVPNAKVNWAYKGINWLQGDFQRTLYNHVLPVNGKSCTNGTRVQMGAYSAGSLHSDGANVLFADDHVAFISASIDSTVWRSLGSRNGGEAIGPLR